MAGSSTTKPLRAKHLRSHWSTIVRFVAIAGLGATACAQQTVVVDGQPMVIQGAMGVDFSAPVAQPGVQPAAQPDTPATEGEAKPAEEEKKEGEEAKPDEKEKKEEASTEVKRPTKPPRVPDPRELDATVDDQGRIQFAFNGQPWPDVLEWLAKNSKMSLDWQELPGDYLNLTTQRSYPLPEARDLVNRHLQMRGFTLLEQGEVLSVVKLDKLDPSLVPRVAEDELYDHPPHQVVKLTFALPKDMDVAKAAEDIKQALSPHAKVLPLAATKQLLVIDNAANLRLVSELLNGERLAHPTAAQPREFILQHARAERALEIVYVVLGMDPQAQPSQMQLEIQQQKMQLLMQMQQSGADVARMLKPDGPPVFLAFNPQRNSILANAPPEQMEIIERTVKLLDVPAAGTQTDVATVDDEQRRLEKYQLKTMDPKNLVQTLSEIGNLSPLADLRADSKTKILFARASEGDHEKIAAMIQELDGESQVTEVFQLRRHAADAVAGTLRALFAEQQAEDDSQNDRNRYYWDPWSEMQQQSDEKPEELRIDADVENNRLLVRGNAKQITEIEDFLRKIGEEPHPAEVADRVRVVDALDPEATAALLKQLRQEWGVMSDNPLLILGPDGKPTGASPPPAEHEEPPVDRETRHTQSPRVQFAVEQTDSESDPTAAQPPAAEGKAPVVVRIAPDGRLMLSSDDPAALNQLEELITSSVPSAPRFAVIELQYVSAFSVWLNLQEMYEEEIKGDEGERRWDWWTDSWVKTGSEEQGMQLSRRKKLRLIYDTPTNTILVANASAAQLDEIEQIIRSYDQPAPADSVKARRTEAVKLEYAQAKIVAAALKEVYRDLLSQRDKEFDSEDKKGAGTVKESMTIIRYGDGESGSSAGGKKTAPMKVGFQGALSVGVDEVANVLIISAQEELFDSIVNVVKVLDEEARPKTSIVVRQMQPGLTSDALRQALSQSLGGVTMSDRSQENQDDNRGEPSRERRQRREGRNNEGRDGNRD